MRNWVFGDQPSRDGGEVRGFAGSLLGAAQPWRDRSGNCLRIRRCPAFIRSAGATPPQRAGTQPLLCYAKCVTYQRSLQCYT
jgi:hypothetical protein